MNVRSKLATQLSRWRRLGAVENYDTGKASEKAGAWIDAANAYQKAVDGDPRRAEWHFRLGRAWEKAGNTCGALTSYQDALARDPDQPEWHFRLGKVLLTMRSFGAATHSFQQADKRFLTGGGSPENVPSRRLSIEQRIELSLVIKPEYSYCILRAAKLASRLNVDRISVLEFGVAGGNGLLAMESHAKEIEEITGVGIDVVGFDSGEGLYAPADIRDMPFYFAPGQYRMDAEQLRARLKRATLVLGDARETFAEFVAAGHPPIGAVSFDMDYYSSTAGVLDIIGREIHEKAFLPRAYTYFDDVTGAGGQDYNDFSGELLAIAEFNEQQQATKLSLDRHFLARSNQPHWRARIYTLHRFQHPDYTTYVGTSSARSLALKS